VAALDVMRLIRDGRLDDAETAATDCFQLGREVGDGDATSYYGAHLLTIRWLQGREVELLGLAREIADSPTLSSPSSPCGPPRRHWRPAPGSATKPP
jgi:hypothetical protein